MTHPLLTLAAAMLAALSSTAVFAAPDGKDTAPPALISEARTFDRLAGTDQRAANRQLSGTFDDFAGGETNAERLVHALRTGEPVELESTGPGDTGASFDPATGAMGWGNVFISLALAQESLDQVGIRQPTTAQLEAALNGGTITVDGQPVVLSGVLAQRADGQGWGQIANRMGVKLGHVISAIRSENRALGAAVGHRPDTAGNGLKKAKADPREHSARFTGHGEANERHDRAERSERPDRPQRPEVANRGGGRDR